MKSLVSVVLMFLMLMVLACSAFAYTTVGFRAYSSAATIGTSCSYVYGTSYADGSFLVQTGATLSLGTKGTASFTPKVDYDYKITCHKSSDGTSVPAKMFFDTESANIFPLSTFLLRVK